MADNKPRYVKSWNEDPDMPSPGRKRKLSEELGVDPAAPSESLEQQRARELEEARAAAARQLEESQRASRIAVDDIEAKAAASRAAAEAQRKSAQTLRDNTKTDLTSSGDPLLIAGGSADQAAALADPNKKKAKAGGISAQVGINV